MYNRRTKIFFGFMVLVMGIGYPLSLLAGTSAFQSLLGGSTSTSSSTEKLVKSARDAVRRKHCAQLAGDPTAKPAKAPSGSKSSRADCTDQLRKLGSGYLALAAPEQKADGTAGDPPSDANDNIDKAITAYLLWQRIDPSDDDASRALGAAYLNRQLPKKAEAVFAKLAAENPDDPDLVFQYAQIAAQAGDNSTAISVFKKYIKQNPDDTNVDTAKEELKQLTTAAKPGAAGGAGASGLPAGVSIG